MAKKIGPRRMKRIKTVFGDDVKFDKDNRPIEQGIGAPGHETLPHYAALAKHSQIAAKLNPTPENIKAAQDAIALFAKKQREHPDDFDDGDEVEDDDF